MRIFWEQLPGGTRRFGVELGRKPGRAVAAPRRTLLLGGARSGKSAAAERMLTGRPDVLYVATGGAREGDEEWARRVALHRERRPAGWRTAETCDLEPLLGDRTDPAPVLVDCLSLWLTAAMDQVGAWDDESWYRGDARDALRARTRALAAAWAASPRRLVGVSNEVGSGVVPATAAGRRFRDELGRLNSAVAEASEQVLLVVAGQILPLRGPGLPR